MEKKNWRDISEQIFVTLKWSFKFELLIYPNTWTVGMNYEVGLSSDFDSHFFLKI